jgi:phosphatidylinositol 4-kinase
LKGKEKSEAHRTCERVHRKCLSMLSSVDATLQSVPETHQLSTSVSITPGGSAANISGRDMQVRFINDKDKAQIQTHLFPALVGIGCVLGAVGSASLFEDAQKMALAQGRQPLAMLEFVLDASPTTPGHDLPRPVSAPLGRRLSIRARSATATLMQRGKQSSIQSIGAPSLEDMQTGQAFSFSRFMVKARSLSLDMSSTWDQMQRRPSDASGPRGLLTLPGSSSSSRRPPTNLRNSHAAEESSIPLRTSFEVQQDALRIQTSQIDLMDSKMLADHHYFHSEVQFVSALMAISLRLCSVPREGRLSSLRAELALLNHNFPARVCIPLWCPASSREPHHHKIVRICPEEAVVLNSADRVCFSNRSLLMQGSLFDFGGGCGSRRSIAGSWHVFTIPPIDRQWCDGC